jgi:hypothetical protein
MVILVDGLAYRHRIPSHTTINGPRGSGVGAQVAGREAPREIEYMADEAENAPPV